MGQRRSARRSPSMGRNRRHDAQRVLCCDGRDGTFPECSARLYRLEISLNPGAATESLPAIVSTTGRESGAGLRVIIIVLYNSIITLFVWIRHLFHCHDVHGRNPRRKPITVGGHPRPSDGPPELGQGTVDEAPFRYWVRQDYVYLIEVQPAIRTRRLFRRPRSTTWERSPTSSNRPSPSRWTSIARTLKSSASAKPSWKPRLRRRRRVHTRLPRAHRGARNVR